MQETEEEEQAPPEEAQPLVAEDPVVLTDPELIQVIKVSIPITHPSNSLIERNTLMPCTQCCLHPTELSAIIIRECCAHLISDKAAVHDLQGPLRRDAMLVIEHSFAETMAGIVVCGCQMLVWPMSHMF